MLRAHHHRLSDGPLLLRPLTESDWDRILPWNDDPEVLWFTEEDDITGRSLETPQAIFRQVSQRAYLFVVELEGRAIRLLARFGLQNEGADAVFGCDVWDFNMRCRRSLESLGFERFATNPQPDGSKGRETFDYVLRP
jgi:RimJ/RimL family protein N-acetyltransferase